MPDPEKTEASWRCTFCGLGWTSPNGAINNPPNCPNSDQLTAHRHRAMLVEVRKMQTSGNVVDHPAHYTAGGIECIDAIEAATTGLEGIEAACTANAVKYLWRWKRKNGVEDLKKAVWYINHLIKKLENK